MISINVLTYGDYTELAERCLESISPILIPGKISDVRIGMNGVCQATRSLIRKWLAKVPDEIGWKAFDPGRNVLKYPLMRRMVHDEKVPMVMGAQLANPPLTMWFDDDSYLRIENKAAGAEFLEKLEKEFLLPVVGMVGEVWFINLRPGQEDWVKSRPWYTGVPIAKQTRFATGGWWTIRTAILRKFDWPDPTIKHNGGDTALAQMLTQQRYRVVDIRDHKWVHVNDALRRGENQNPAGHGYVSGTELDLSHQQFECTVYTKGINQL